MTLWTNQHCARVGRNFLPKSLHDLTPTEAQKNLYQGGEREATTLPAFAPFAQRVVQPLLLDASPLERWLQPLLKPAAALRAYLLNPSPPRGQEAVMLATAPRAERPNAARARSTKGGSSEALPPQPRPRADARVGGANKACET